MQPARDSHGRFKADHRVRNWTLGATLVGAVAAGLAALLRKKAASEVRRGGAGHSAPDLAASADTPGTDRAPTAFRPDPTATPSAEDREALRPATGPSPTLVADRGEMNAQTGPGSAREDIAVARAPG